MSVHEECGVFGVISPENCDVASMSYYGLYALQHRGQESCGITAVGGEFIRDVEPGEILVFSEQGVVSKKEHCNKKDKKLCIFEYIYFSRPDSVIDGVSVHASRVRAGEILA